MENDVVQVCQEDDEDDDAGSDVQADDQPLAEEVPPPVLSPAGNSELLEQKLKAAKGASEESPEAEPSMASAASVKAASSGSAAGHPIGGAKGPAAKGLPEEDWQSGKSGVKEKNAFMFNNPMMADVWFSVGSEELMKQIERQNSYRPPAFVDGTLMSRSVPPPERRHQIPLQIPAHRYVLATGSSVFYAMFYGGFLPDATTVRHQPEVDVDDRFAVDRFRSNADATTTVVVPDAEPEAFLTMLKYLYYDEIDLTADNVLATLYVAKKYLVPALSAACVRFLEGSLTARNACVILSQARFFDEKELMQRCWEVVDAQAELALSSDSFVEVDLATLNLVLARDTLNCRETEVFRAAIRWAEAECQRRSSSSGGGIVAPGRGDEHQVSNATAGAQESLADRPRQWREALGRAIYLVRFPTMTVHEFADTAATSGMLSLKETTDIFLHFTARKKPNLDRLGFASVEPRTGLPRQVCHRFGSSHHLTNQWRYRGRADSIQFCVDRRVFVLGYGLYGSSSGCCDYVAHMQLKTAEAGPNSSSSPPHQPSRSGGGGSCSSASNGQPNEVEGKVLSENTVRFRSDGSNNTFQVFFNQPVQVEPDVHYTASVVLDGPELSFFGQEGKSEVSVGCVTFQFFYSHESTNGTGVQGGQIPEIIFYGPAKTVVKPLPSGPSASLSSSSTLVEAPPASLAANPSSGTPASRSPTSLALNYSDGSPSPQP